MLAEIDPEVLREPDPSAALAIARAATPDFVHRWFDGLQSHAASGGLLFVHAGVNPDLPLDAFLAAPWDTPLSQLETSAHWAWIRAIFLAAEPGSGGFFGYFVVHGHSPLDVGYTHSHAEQIARSRLNLDGGSGHTGMAKLAIFHGSQVEVLTTRGQTNAEL